MCLLEGLGEGSRTASRQSKLLGRPGLPALARAQAAVPGRRWRAVGGPRLQQHVVADVVQANMLTVVVVNVGED